MLAAEQRASAPQEPPQEPPQERNFPARTGLDQSEGNLVMIRCAVMLLCSCVALPLAAQQPPGVPETLAGLASQPSSHFSFTLDRSQLAQAQQLMGTMSASTLDSVTVETYRYQQPAFYDPGAFANLVGTYQAAGWKHLVNANAGPAANAQPKDVLTDLWLYFEGTDIEGVTVLVRGARQMNVVEVSGLIKPLDLLHLGGHFGIPKVDPGAVMVPAPAGH